MRRLFAALILSALAAGCATSTGPNVVLGDPNCLADSVCKKLSAPPSAPDSR